MPEISRFLGIVITMFYNDHGPPHFHATYGDHAITISIRDENVTGELDRKSTRLNSSHDQISYAVFCLKKKITRRVRHLRISLLRAPWTRQQFSKDAHSYSHTVLGYCESVHPAGIVASQLGELVSNQGGT